MMIKLFQQDQMKELLLIIINIMFALVKDMFALIKDMYATFNSVHKRETICANIYIR